MDAPDTEYSVPDGHAEQEEAPFAEYVPPSQSEQRLSPLPEYFPPGHERHASPFAENVPGEQKAHVAPSPLGAAPAPQVALHVTRSVDRSRLSLHGTTQPSASGSTTYPSSTGHESQDARAVAFWWMTWL